MMTVHEVSLLSGVSIRTLQYYDRIGLLPPDGVTEAGYRLYGEKALERLQQILLFRELEFPLKDIARIVNAPDFDRAKALSQQIELLTMKKEHLEGLIVHARKILGTGEKTMDFNAFDTKKMDDMPPGPGRPGERPRLTKSMKRSRKAGAGRKRRRLAAG